MSMLHFDWLLKDMLCNNYKLQSMMANLVGATEKRTLSIFFLFVYTADRTPRPTYICLPAGLIHAR